jgi:hypothetical protein
MMPSSKSGFHFRQINFPDFGEVLRRDAKIEACPFLKHSCFQKITFPIFGGWRFGVKKWLNHVPKSGILIFKKQLLPFSGDATTVFAQKLQKWTQN